jgi:hypothetical protein
MKLVMWKLHYKSIKVLFTHLIVFTLFYLFYELNSYSRYPFLRVGDAWFDRKFDDTYQVLNSAQCYATIGRSIYDQITCSYLYGSPLLDVINLIGVSPMNVNFVGELFLCINIMIFTFISVRAYNKFGIKRILLCVLIFISPPFHYLIERGNFDTLIILMLLISCIFISRGKLIFGSIFLGIASAIKFYTLPVLLVYLLYLKFSKSKHLKFHLAIGIITGLIVFRDYLHIRGILGSGTGGYGGTFGLKSIALYANHLSTYFNTTLVFLVTILIFTLVIFVILFKFSLRKPRFHALDSFSYVIQLVFGLQIVICYLITINNDYRLSILGIFLSALLIRSPMNSGLERNILIFGLIAMWLSYPSWILQVLGDISLVIAIFLIINSILRAQFKPRVNNYSNDSFE